MPLEEGIPPQKNPMRKAEPDKKEDSPWNS